jgi:hypothetical protein
LFINKTRDDAHGPRFVSDWYVKSAEPAAEALNEPKHIAQTTTPHIRAIFLYVRIINSLKLVHFKGILSHFTFRGYNTPMKIPWKSIIFHEFNQEFSSPTTASADITPLPKYIFADF